MKKSTLFWLMAAAASVPGVAMAADENYPASASTDLYDQSPWANEQIIKLFSDAYDRGENFPTKAEFEKLGLTFDLEFARSHTRINPIYVNDEANVVKTINAARKLWCNLPAGYGKNIGGWPTATFDQDVFSMWNYTNLFGSWNYGWLQAPGAWIDAAHRNGTRIFSGIKFFESWNDDGSEAALKAFISTKNTDGTYKYAPAMVNAAAFFGNDGFNYNQEGSMWGDDDWVAFHKAVNKNAKDRGFTNFGIGQYTQQAGLTANNVSKIYGDATSGQAFDCMLNYSGNKLAYRYVPQTLTQAEACGLGLDNVYQGQLLVGISTDYWTQMNTDDAKKVNICIWGEHDQSRFFQFRAGTSPTNVQENYQILLEKAFSGANRNPLNRPEINNSWGLFEVPSADKVGEQMSNSPGFASMIAERTAVGGNLPFETNFCLGNGENYFYKGKVTHGAWYNMSQQDMVPTYRWRVTAKDDMNQYANDIDVRFTHEDAYIGGSSLRITGKTAGNDLILYRSNLAVGTGNVKATLALKSNVAGKNASNLSLLIRTKGASNYVVVPVGDLAGNSWEEKELPISGLGKGDVIEYIGLRVEGSSDNYKMLVGKLKISDDSRVQQALIKKNSLIVEVKAEETKQLSVKLNWEPDGTGFNTSYNQYGNIYNDEINVDHFEIVYKEGANGKVKEIGRTSQWATFIGNIPLEQNANAFIGVRSVSTDLTSVSPVEWVEIPRYSGVLPETKVENPYGVIYLANTGGASLEAIKTGIYWEKVTTEGATQNLNYVVTTNPADDNNYYYAADHVLKVEQGQEISLFVKGLDNRGTANSGQCIRYDLSYAYLDYDGNYSFDDADELLGNIGENKKGVDAIVDPGITIKFKVPTDAKPGSSLLRIVSSDAWGAHPGATGGTWKGYGIDFPVEITGNNTPREAAKTYKDYRDKGDIEEPEYVETGLSAGFEGVTIDGGAVSTLTVDGDVVNFSNVDKAWFFAANGQMVKFVTNAPSQVSISDLATGVYVVKMQNGQVVRSQKIVKK